ncbi:MAG: lipoyl(octanoyl) transferase LipB [Planctomycetaceae bacterium]
MTSHSTVRTSPRRSGASLEVYLLGSVDFESLLFLQERVLYDIGGRNDSQGTLFIAEHPPLITVGREGSRAHIRLEPKELGQLGLEVRWLNRGGGCLVHGPGQVAVYPILPLDRLGLGLDQFKKRLEQTVIDMAGDIRVEAQRSKGCAGVASRSGQFAFIGAAVKRWTTHHGMYVNVDPSMRLMRLADADGCGGKISSLAAERGLRACMHTVREGLVRHFAEQFEYDNLHVYTGHPLLKRTTRETHVYA